MRNKSGSVLIIALGFVVVFTLLGMASIYLATLQNETAELRKIQEEAFWLADGAVQYAKAKLPSPIPKEDSPIYDNPEDFTRFYDVHTKRKNLGLANEHQFRWEVLTYGSVNGQNRYVRAEINKFNIPDHPLSTTEDPINPPVSPNIVLAIDPFNSSDLPCTFEYENNIIAEGFIDATCITVEDSGNLYVPRPNDGSVTLGEDGQLLPPDPDGEQVGGINYVASDVNVLYVDVTIYNESNPSTLPNIYFDGPIDGIVIIKGDANVFDLNVAGVVLADGTINFEGSNNSITFNSVNIDQAFALTPLNGFPSGGSNYSVVSWEELDVLPEEI